MTFSSHRTFELMVTVHERSSTSSFLLYSLFSDALGVPSRLNLGFPAHKNQKQRSTATRTLLISWSHSRTSSFGHQAGGSTLDFTPRSTWGASILGGRST